MDDLADEATHPRREETCPSPRTSASGSVTLITGCMFSGKTTELLRRFEAFERGAVRAFKHVIDERYAAEAIVSHGGLAWPAVRIASAGEILAHVDPVTRVAAVDEAHFFDRGLVEVTRKLAIRGLDVIITSLNVGSWGQPFAVTEQLRSVSDEHVSLKAICAACGSPAERTQRLTPIVDGGLVGGPESYEPRCDNCWRPPPEPVPTES